MNEKLTPADEFKADRERVIAKGVDQLGGYGAFCRLMKIMDTVQVTDWLKNERNRGATEDEIAQALGNYFANAMAPFCAGPHAIQRALDVVGHQTGTFASMISGEGQVEVLAINRRDGRQVLTTMEGLRKGMPK